MLKNKVHYETKIDEEEFTFICRSGCLTAKALQAVDEYRTYIFGLLKQQEETEKQSKQEPKKEEPIQE